jgi:hypothetical protein
MAIEAYAGRVPPVVPFAATVLVALCVFLVPRVGAAEWKVRTRLLPVAPLVYVALLFAYVFGEDSYRGNGISRWDAYRSPGGALEPMFFATVALMVLANGFMILAAARQQGRLMRASTVGATVVAMFLGIPTIMGFSLN